MSKPCNAATSRSRGVVGAREEGPTGDGRRASGLGSGLEDGAAPFHCRRPPTSLSLSPPSSGGDWLRVQLTSERLVKCTSRVPSIVPSFYPKSNPLTGFDR